MDSSSAPSWRCWTETEVWPMTRASPVERKDGGGLVMAKERKQLPIHFIYNKGKDEAQILMNMVFSYSQIWLHVN